MADFSIFDSIALGIYVFTWTLYHCFTEFGIRARASLNSLMNELRFVWMQRTMERDNRMVDSSLLNGLQSGTAFFASTSLLALGGSLSAMGATDKVIEVFAALPFGVPTTRTMYELKILGLCGIFTYTFFKMAWAYRLFNYVAILVGAAPLTGTASDREVRIAVERTARMHVSAGRHFNRGMRGFFFALAYLGWFAGPFVFLGTTAAVVFALFRRQFGSDSRHAILWEG
jgi:uncharacterized membrane protein